MGELMNTKNGRAIRWELLSAASALALLASTYAAGEAKAVDDDTDRPTFWIELGGELQHVGGQGDSFPVEFLVANPNSPVLKPVSPLQAQKPPAFEFAQEGKFLLQPEGSDLVFSAAVNYGRSSNFKHVDHQTDGTYKKYLGGGPPAIYTAADFADTQVHRKASSNSHFGPGRGFDEGGLSRGVSF